ncbi:MAG: bifunctional adenosylcobinamide kinase/adenosylcobinamide-phosphate guanylyltransferase [Rhizobiales bacterium]|nr:bifunctional adenosylcobinamide kinase/adenosylcobinamide-phosphate guanylyltransferase [Hyphomicrobiales bacterium]
MANDPATRRTALVLGGARSGKSRFAETLAVATGLPLVYVATAEARDGEMAERIAHHRTRRGAHWTTIEAPLDLGTGEQTVLVDCLTLWLANLLESGRDADAEGERLAASIAHRAGPLILVSNEVGSGIVPVNALARRFADAQGRLNQTIAAAVTQVFLVAGGQPLRLKPRTDPEYSL